MIFGASCMFWIPFLSRSRFFDISLNSSVLFLLYVEAYAKGYSLLSFLRVRSSSDVALSVGL